MSEPEIKMRNPKLRMAANIAIIALFIIVFVWQTIGATGARAQVKELKAQIAVLERDTTKNEQTFLTEQTLSEQSRNKLTVQGQVEESQRLQGLRDKMESSRALREKRKEQVEELNEKARSHQLIIILSLVGGLILLWVNYILDY
jgi:hypothetical protein